MEYTISEVLDRLNLEHGPKKMDCPFCGGKNKLGFSDEKGMWHCYTCHESGGSLSFYVKYVLGIPLPSNRIERGKLSRQLREFMGDPTLDAPNMAQQHKESKPKFNPICVANDAHLHAVYSAMAALPMFQLLPEHRKKLLQRGLTDRQIERNGYRSYPFRTNIPEKYVKLYMSVDAKIRNQYNKKKAAQIQMGLMAADMLMQSGFSLNGVPGFYKFGGNWCLTYIPGILIPTRNIYGQIVIWQVRRNIAPKYMTLSCGGKPGAVTDEVSRAHFPVGSYKNLSAKTPLYFTEGPLKADVAVALQKKRCVFVAIPGIDTTKDLLSYCKQFQDAGITKIGNALDMDRLTNPNVRRGSRKLEAAFTERGMTVIPLYWDDNHAASTLLALATIAKIRSIPVHTAAKMNVFERLDATAEALDEAGIKPFSRGDGEPCYWDPDTKGIDDYLFSLRSEETGA